MSIPLLRGRDLDASRRSRPAAPTVIVSKSFADRFRPGQTESDGQTGTLTFYPGVAREVVGVVGDTNWDSLD